MKFRNACLFSLSFAVGCSSLTPLPSPPTVPRINYMVGIAKTVAQTSTDSATKIRYHDLLVGAMGQPEYSLQMQRRVDDELYREASSKTKIDNYAFQKGFFLHNEDLFEISEIFPGGAFLEPIAVKNDGFIWGFYENERYPFFLIRNDARKELLFISKPPEEIHKGLIPVLTWYNLDLLSETLGAYVNARIIKECHLNEKEFSFEATLLKVHAKSLSAFTLPSTDSSAQTAVKFFDAMISQKEVQDCPWLALFSLQTAAQPTFLVGQRTVMGRSLNAAYTAFVVEKALALDRNLTASVIGEAAWQIVAQPKTNLLLDLSRIGKGSNGWVMLQDLLEHNALLEFSSGETTTAEKMFELGLVTDKVLNLFPAQQKKVAPFKAYFQSETFDKEGRLDIDLQFNVKFAHESVSTPLALYIRGYETCRIPIFYRDKWIRICDEKPFTVRN